MAVDARILQLRVHRIEPSRGGRRQTALTQEPPQQIAAAMRRHRAQRFPRKRRAVARALRVDRREVVDQCGSFGLELRGAGDGRRVTGRHLRERGDDLFAQCISRITDIGVAVVIDKRQATRFNVSVNDGARHVEQRPQPEDAGGVGPRARHRRQSVRAGAAQQLQQHGFGLVVLVVRKENRLNARLDRGCGERGIARSPRFCLDAFACAARDVDATFEQRNRSRRAQLDAKARPCVGVR